MAESLEPAVLVFPQYLQTDAFEFRKFTINILEAESLGAGAQSAMDAAMERVKSLSGSAEQETSAAPDDIISNLEANYDREVAANTILSIVLPLPNTFTDTQSHSWNTEKGLLGAAGGAIESTGLSGALPKKLADKLSGLGENVLPGAVSNGLSAVGNYSIGTALGSIANATGTRKPLVDPGYFQNYTGSEPREFNFSFDFVPSNIEEAETMIQIILKLKEYSSPELAAGGVSILAPHFFDIAISNRFISGMASLRGVVLKSISLDYGADGYMQQFPGGYPKYIKMDLTFAERKMMTAGHFRKNLYREE